MPKMLSAPDKVIGRVSSSIWCDLHWKKDSQGPGCRPRVKVHTSTTPATILSSGEVSPSKSQSSYQAGQQSGQGSGGRQAGVDPGRALVDLISMGPSVQLATCPMWPAPPETPAIIESAASRETTFPGKQRIPKHQATEASADLFRWLPTCAGHWSAGAGGLSGSRPGRRGSWLPMAANLTLHFRWGRRSCRVALKSLRRSM